MGNQTVMTGVLGLSGRVELMVMHEVKNNYETQCSSHKLTCVQKLQTMLF